MWPLLYLPKGEIKVEKLYYRQANLPGMIKDLSAEAFNGYIEILALQEKGLIVFHQGEVVSCFYEGTDELELTQEQIIRHFLDEQSKESDTIINVYGLTAEMIVSLSALCTPAPIHRELESSFMDMNKLVETLARKRYDGVLRFYRIRNNTRLGNLLLRMNKISSDQLREAVRLQLSRGGALRLGDALVEIGAIAPAELEDALDRQSYTRKGSDLEIAIALFYQGQFLGGYTQENGIIITSLPKVLSWMSGSRDVLMDIIESHMPGALNIDRLLQTPWLPVDEFAEGSNEVSRENSDEKKAGPTKSILEKTDNPPDAMTTTKSESALPTQSTTRKNKQAKSEVSFLKANLKAVRSSIKRITEEESFHWQPDDLILEPNVNENHPVAEAHPKDKSNDRTQQGKSKRAKEDRLRPDLTPQPSSAPHDSKPVNHQKQVTENKQGSKIEAIDKQYLQAIRNEKMSLPPDPPENEYEASISLDSLIKEIVPDNLNISNYNEVAIPQDEAIEPLIAEIQSDKKKPENKPENKPMNSSQLAAQPEPKQASNQASIEKNDDPARLPEQTEAIPDEVLAVIEKVATVFSNELGFIGRAVLQQEQRLAVIPDRAMTIAQFRAVVKRALKSVGRLTGSKKVTQVENELIEDLGVLM